MKNKDNDTSAIHEKSTGESSKKISKKENRIITIIMFGVIAPLLLIAQHYYDAMVEFLSEHISRYIDWILDFWTKPDTGLYDCQSQIYAEIYVRMLATSFYIAYMLYAVFTTH